MLVLPTGCSFEALRSASQSRETSVGMTWLWVDISAPLMFLSVPVDYAGLSAVSCAVPRD